MYKYFTNDDFERASPSCAISDMSSDFLHLLDRCRDYAGIPFIVNSAYRSSEYERSKGRSGSGAHTRGVAVDIRCLTNLDRYRIVSAAVRVGIPRIGIATNFVHLDMDVSLPCPRIWLYT